MFVSVLVFVSVFPSASVFVCTSIRRLIGSSLSLPCVVEASFEVCNYLIFFSFLSQMKAAPVFSITSDECLYIKGGSWALMGPTPLLPHVSMKHFFFQYPYVICINFLFTLFVPPVHCSVARERFPHVLPDTHRV